MKSFSTLNSYFLCLAVAFCLLMEAIPQPAGASSSDSIMATIERANEPYDNTSVEGVLPVVRETVAAHERYQGGTFQVTARKKEMARYPCSGCHTGKPITVQNSAELTHGNISLSHGRPGALACIDCHSQENRNFLEDKKGKTIDFNHSYQLCGQCHFRQKKDWLGGAHGKRIEYWAGERVILNCVSCHDPHSPRFEKRFPVTYSPEIP